MKRICILLMITLSTGLADDGPVLKKLVGDRFLIGAALNHGIVAGTGPAEQVRHLATRHYNTATPENALKWQSTHPAPGVWTFEESDAFVEYCEKNGMTPIGHTLVWDHQTPAWVFKDATREILLERMREHIHKVVGRYRGQIKGWDVVNEALADNGKVKRNSKWCKIIGPDFIEHAFRYAHEADPEAELYYNDYSADAPAKRDGMIALFKRLREAGIRIDGLGNQAHWRMESPSIKLIEECIVKFHAAGAKVMFTELDMSVLPWPGFQQAGAADITQKFGYQEKFNPYRDGLPYGVARRQAVRYADLFKLFVKHHDKIDRVTFWGVNDAHTWLNNWPVKGRTNYPLLFDRQGQPKPAFTAVVNVLRKE